MMYVGLAILAVALIVLIATHDSGRIGEMSTEDFASMASLSALLILVSAGFWQGFRARLGENMRNILIWVAIGLVLVVGYTQRDRAQEIGTGLMGAIRPGSAVVGPGGEVTITRRSDGEYSVYATVNGQAEQRFMFDTGASSVVLTHENATALGIAPKDGEYQTRVSTANGSTWAAPTRLQSITIGPITERNVDALVSRPGDLTGNLLGQSFLTRLPSYEVRGDKLVLRSR